MIMLMVMAAMPMLMLMMVIMTLKSTLGDGALGILPHRVHLVVQTLDELPCRGELGLQGCGSVSG